LFIAANLYGGWRAVAGPFVTRFPNGFSSRRIKRHDPRSATADVDEQLACYQDRRASRAEVTLVAGIVGIQRALPDLFARCERHAPQVASRSEDIHFAVRHQWYAARTFVGVNSTAIGCGEVSLPDRAARFRIDGFDPLAIARAMKHDHALPHNRRSRISAAQLVGPQLRRSARGPSGCQLFAGCLAIATRSQNLRPIAGPGARRTQERQAARQSQNQPAALKKSNHRSFSIRQ